MKAVAKLEPRCRFEHSPRVFFRMQLLWAKRNTPMYRPLSLNIIREVCEYYQCCRQLLLSRGRRIFAFDPLTCIGAFSFEVDAMLGPGMMLNYTFMGQERVFMMLRNSTSAFEDFPYFGVYTNGSLDTMDSPGNQYYNAIIYDERKHVVYILAGENTIEYPHRTTKCCEKYNPIEKTLTPTTPMQSERRSFGCCWHYGYIYLCGGTVPGIETFDPHTETFSYFSALVFDVEFDCNFLAGSLGGELVLVSNRYVWKEKNWVWSKTLREEQVEMSSSFRNSTCIVYENSLFFPYSRRFAKLDLLTMQETVYQPIAVGS